MIRRLKAVYCMDVLSVSYYHDGLRVTGGVRSLVSTVSLVTRDIALDIALTIASNLQFCCHIQPTIPVFVHRLIVIQGWIQFPQITQGGLLRTPGYI